MEDNDDNNQLISNDDIDMLNTVDLKPSTSKQSDDFNLLDSNGDSLDDSFISDSDTKTPGEILDEFCVRLNDINTTLPDSVVNHYMKKTGFLVNDPKLIKIISIASQKFISEIVNDVMQHHKLKTKSASQTTANNPGQTSGSATTSNPAGANGESSSNATANQSSNKLKQVANAAASASNTGLTLTLEDLTQVLTEYGINVKKPYYFM